ncbi:phospholipase D-like domain-containing protein [Pirellulaceae bacterium SH449]
MLMPIFGVRDNLRRVASILWLLVFAVLVGQTAHSSDNVRFLVSETEALATRLMLIENASASIRIASYQIRDDNSGGQLLAALLSAAERGVMVRVMVDAHPNSNNLPKPLIRFLVERGVEIRERPFDARSKLEIGRPRLHDKLFAVDSTHLIMGGRNLEQDYFGLGNRRYIDFDVLANGEIACAAERYFDERWQERVTAVPRLTGLEQAKMLKKQVHAEWNGQTYCTVVPQIEQWLNELRTSELQAADLPCRLSTDFRDHQPCHIEFLRDYTNMTKQAPNSISSRILQEIESARSSLIISTPYFVIPISLRDALIRAVKRGVSVTILTNSLESTDQVIVHAEYVNVRRALVRHGIIVREMQGTNPLHTKLIVIDGYKTIVGSHNLDMLSMKRNSEVGLLVTSSEFAEEALLLFSSLTQRAKVVNQTRLLRYEARESHASQEKISQYQRLRTVAPLIRRYL